MAYETRTARIAIATDVMAAKLRQKGVQRASIGFDDSIN